MERKSGLRAGGQVDEWVGSGRWLELMQFIKMRSEVDIDVYESLTESANGGPERPKWLVWTV